MFRGSYVALATPFDNQAIDWENLERLVQWHLDNQTDGLVPCGTTGETPTLTHDEQVAVVERVLQLGRGKIPIMAGCGSNSTEKTIELAQTFEKMGVSALLIVTPYYNRPSQRGLYEHYSTIAKAVQTPIFIYNVPSRTGSNILPATVTALAKAHANIAGIKEASGNLDQVSAIIHDAPNGFIVLSGDDSLTLPMLACGAKGVISVVANVVPREIAGMVAAWDMGDWEKARRMHIKLFPIFKALFLETNPVPVKTAMHKMGLIKNLEFRKPLVAMTKENEEKLMAVLKDLSLLGTANQ